MTQVQNRQDKSPPNEARKEIAKMLIAFPSPGDDKDQRVKLEVYWEALKVYPAECVIAACKAAIRGDVGGGVYLPSSAEITREAARRAQLVERHSRPALPPPAEREVPEDERKRVADGLIALTKQLARGNSLDAATRRRRPLSDVTQPEAESGLERLREAGPLPPLSDAARKTCGLNPMEG